MKLFRNLLTEDEAPISSGELSHVEKYLNGVWEHLGIDFEFTKHFFERVNDPRNGKQIKAVELVKIFTDVYKKYGQMIAKKVTPDTEKKFDSVLTDLSTKVNSPVIVVWNKEKKQLEMVAKTVMRVNHFYTHPDQPRLTVQHYEPQGKVITEKKMKTFKDITEWVGWNTPEVAPIATPQAVDDVDSAAFSVERPEILDKLNAYCHDIANHQYINPYYPLNTLWKKLMMIGINFDLKKIMMMGEQGRVEVPITQFGGRFGALGDPSSFVSKDDGTRVAGGLNLVITYQKTGGVYTLDVHIERGFVPSAMGFGEEVSEAKEFHSTGSYTNHPFHTTLVKHGYEHETSHDQDPRGRVHSYFHPKTQHVIAIGSTGGKPAWGSEQSNGESAATLSKHIKDVNSLSSDDAKKWRIARPNLKKK
jgi:hypothetical protein